MMHLPIKLAGSFFLCLTFHVCVTNAQLPDSSSLERKKNLVTYLLYKQPGTDSMVDFRDAFRYVFRHGKKSQDTNQKKIKKTQTSFVPAVLYSLSTGFAVSLNANSAFYPKNEKDNLSNILTNVSYTQYKQVIVQAATNIWTKDNGYNINTNWSYLKFPQKDFGLGGYSSLDRLDFFDYSYLRLYQSVLKKIGRDLYIGPGINIDYHWNITDTSTVNKPLYGAREYGLPAKTNSTGITLNLLFDTRKNLANPIPGGSLFNLVYRNNVTWLGSNQNTQTLVIDTRKYFRFPANSNNILAFWNYNWFTLQGRPPYLDLPATGWDAYTNTGRGFIQGRFRGNQMLYLESEYRFRITENGLLGAVIFANAQSFSETPGGKIKTMAPGYGAGIRIKFNKHSNTNVAIDYGFGKGGSHGFSMNLGEVF